MTVLSDDFFTSLSSSDSSFSLLMAFTSWLSSVQFAILPGNTKKPQECNIPKAFKGFQTI